MNFIDTGSAILNPFQSIWISFVGILPSLIAALLLIILGYLLGTVLGHILKVALEKIGVEKKLQKIELTRNIGKMHFSAICGELLKWYVLIIFLQAGVDLLNLGALSDVLTTFVNWMPQLIVGVIVILFGMLIAHYVEMKIRENSDVKGVRLSAVVLKWIIVFAVILTALKEIGLDISLFENAFYLVFGAIAIGLALALGIGLGLGMRKGGERFIDKIMNNF